MSLLKYFTITTVGRLRKRLPEYLKPSGDTLDVFSLNDTSAGLSWAMVIALSDRYGIARIIEQKS